MAPYQKALKEYLQKQDEKFNIQLREADNELKVKKIFSSMKIQPCFSFLNRKRVKNVKHLVLLCTICNKN